MNAGRSAVKKELQKETNLGSFSLFSTRVPTYSLFMAFISETSGVVFISCLFK